MKQHEKATVGWREWIALPDLAIARIKAKIDTGARTSALHAWDIEPFTRGGVKMVRFKVHPIQRDTHDTVVAEAPLIEHRHVRSSTGTATRRPVIATTIQWFDQRYEIELTLINRDAMGFRMLLGRSALRGRFIIDTGRSYLANKRQHKTNEPQRTRRTQSKKNKI